MGSAFGCRAPTPRCREGTLLLNEGVDYYIRRAAPSRLAAAHISEERVY